MDNRVTADSSTSAGSVNPAVVPAEIGERAVSPAYVLGVLATGATAGLGGMALALLLHAIQHLAYGYSLTAVISDESFLQGVSAAPPLRRLAVLTMCGAIAGIGWWTIYRFGRPLVSIRATVANPDRTMPAFPTLGHALLQIITVALGSPLGREVAPREVATLLAGWIARGLRLTHGQTRIVLACGAGAGLAAVYNVPLGGALFVMEVLLGSFALPVVIPALATSVIAAYVAWIGLGDASQYVLPHLGISLSLVLWSAAVGPPIGCAGWLYSKLARKARQRAPRNGWVIPQCVLAFAGIGGLAMVFPELLGNGKGPIQLGLDGQLDLPLAAILLVLKLAAATAVLRAGAEGGLLTPGMTIGALLGLLLGALWTVAWPTTAAPGAFALVGAAAFLSVSMRMPVTAIVLAYEFTRADHDFFVPILIAVAGAAAAGRLCEGRLAGVVKP